MLRDIFKTGKFVVTAEISPPKGTKTEELLEKAEILRDRVDGINVTDNQRAIMKLSSLAFSRLLLERGFKPIMQMSCRDRNALGLQSEILGAAVLGIKNILVISGDYPEKNQEQVVRPVFDLDSVQLIDLITKLEQGKDLAGDKLDGKPSFCVGAVVNPGAEPLEPQIIKLKKKIEAGAEFIQTQVTYDVKAYKKFVKQIKDIVGVKFLTGILPLRSYKMANFLNEHVAGVSVPPKLLRRMEKAKDPHEEGINIAVETINELKDLCDGVHLMVMNRIETVPEILKRTKL